VACPHCHDVFKHFADGTCPVDAAKHRGKPIAQCSCNALIFATDSRFYDARTHRLLCLDCTRKMFGTR
jgi:hypothetical protein